MAESTENKSDTRAELATMREQMAEMFHMLKALQSDKGKDNTGGSQHHSDTGNTTEGGGTSQTQKDQKEDSYESPKTEPETKAPRSVKKPAFMKKKDAETHFIASEPKRFPPRNDNQNNYRAPSRFTQNPPQNQNPVQHQTPIRNPPNQNQPRLNFQQQKSRNNNNYQQERRPPVFDRIPMTYTDLFAYLQRQGIVTPIMGRVPDNPGPWFNPDATCAYHSGAPGHLLENCRAFKLKVQDLINSRRIDFRETRPNVTGNPLPNHGNQETNAIETGGETTIIREVRYVKMPMGFIFQEMRKQGFVELVAREADGE
ncbi:unnamed protein product [Lupinus luteus]|uniref:Gag-pol polyprotein n=1 Tax=Lupinus luteus TaxID=3873 RepID=A0AAV1XDP6_LUPLU